jgi:hypothetical protein
MGKQQLQEDYITWVLDLNATKAEQEYHKLDKESQNLRDRQREINKELKDLRQHPRKNAAEIKKLTGEYKAHSATIQDNTNKMKLLSRQMGTANLSMSQLRRHASDLQRQLDKTSRALHPKEWETLNAQLVETKKRMSDLKMESSGFDTRNIVEGAGLANLWSTALTRLFDKAKEFASESITMAESADGVQRAFDKLDRPDLLDKLRAATKGTVNDFELMKAAVKARDFRIPLDDLGKYLTYAQMKAQETGQSVDYMTESIIMGLGRKSKPILDNLGLSAAEINEEVAKTGDFVTGVTAIVDRQLAAAGEAYESAADRATRASVELENAQLKLGQALIPVKERWNEVAANGARVLSFMIEYRKITKPVITAIAALILAKAKFNATTLAGNVALKAQNLLLSTTKIVVLAAKAAYNLMTGNLVRAAAAQRALNAAIASNPLGAILTAVAAVVSIITTFINKAREAADTVSVMDRVGRRLADTEDTTAQRIRNLTATLHDNTKSLDERRAALDELMKIVPGYNAELTAEGKLINENTDAMDRYLEKLEQTAKMKAAEEELTDLYKRQIELQQKISEGERKLRGEERVHAGELRKLSKEYKANKKELEAVNADISTLSTSIFNMNQAAAAGGAAPKSLIKELEEQRKQLVEERDLATTEEEIKAKNKEIEIIDAKIKRLQDLGKTTKDTAADEQTATQLLSQQRSQLLEQEKQAADTRTALLKKQLDEGLISQAEYDVRVAESAVTSAQERLKIEQDLQASVKTMTFKTAAEREKAEADAAQRVLETETAVNKARTDEEQVFRNNLKAIRESGALDQEKTLAQQREQELAALDIYYQAALKQAGDNAEQKQRVNEAYWEASWRIMRKYNEKEQALKDKEVKEREQIREQLGLVSWKAALDARQQLLEEALRKRAITEDEYAHKSTQIWMEAWHEQTAYYQNLAASAFETLMQSEMDLSAARYDILISQAQKAGEDTAALEEEKEAKQLEIQKKYADVNFAVKASQIIADTAVSIMQAYAQLGPVAGTVAALLMGVVGAAQLASANAERERVKQLQPGSAAASSSGANTRVLTGREKGGYISVRRRQDGKLFRNVAVEADKRGYIDRPTVIVGEGPQSKEFVASNAAVENPTVAPLLDIIDKAQMAGNIRTLDMNREIQARMIGRGSGGTMDDSQHRQRHPADAKMPVVPAAGIDTLERLDETLRSLQRDGIPASVALTEIDRKRELRERARKIGSKK